MPTRPAWDTTCPSMADNMYGTNYGPSTSGAFNVTAGQTYGALCGPSSATINDSPCAAPPGLNTADPLSSNITTGPGGPTSVADQSPAGPGTTFSDVPGHGTPPTTAQVCSQKHQNVGGSTRGGLQPAPR